MSEIKVVEFNIEELFNKVVFNTNITELTPNKFPLELDLDSPKDLFTFLLEFFTMISKYLFGDENTKVNLNLLSNKDFEKINKYMTSIGFKANYQILPANAYNINYTATNRYDKKEITPQTILNELFLGIKIEQRLFIISFEKI